MWDPAAAQTSVKSFSTLYNLKVRLIFIQYSNNDLLCCYRQRPSFLTIIAIGHHQTLLFISLQNFNNIETEESYEKRVMGN